MQNASSKAFAHGGGSIGDVKLAVDLFHVVAHRVHADAQLVGDLFFYESFAQ